MNFAEFFSLATGTAAAYDYQHRLANSPVISRAIRVPTGAGKTAAAILAWMWKRQSDPRQTPRKLLYCLPMRTLAEQTHRLACAWRGKLGLDIPVYLLMGGAVEQDWETEPEQPAILIGTQEMLLSRVLNRGYAMSRHGWPIHFALLNNDSLLVCDEVQLMSSGLATTLQLDAWRKTLGSLGPSATWWMSATLGMHWLDTVDHPSTGLEIVELSNSDRAHPELSRRIDASKPLRSVTPQTETDLARLILEQHKPRSLTLVVVNTVDRAQKTWRELQNRVQRIRRDQPELMLLHSRYRPPDRAALETRLRENKLSGIVIATQVVEAGLDISARTLITDLAPWSSLVQRFGRCNRKGEFTVSDPAEILVLDVGTRRAPYSKEEIESARARLSSLENAALSIMDTLEPPQEQVYTQVIRRKDLLDLFDTTPDLTGADLDVSRYIREGEELDAYVFWRNLENEPDATEPAPAREELCPVSISSLREFRRDRILFRYDPLDEKWRVASSVVPGQIYLLRSQDGGYSQIGWDPSSTSAVEPLPPAEASEHSYEGDPRSSGPWRTIADHTNNVCAELEVIISRLPLTDSQREALREAARWHDWGKAHHVFQQALPCDHEHPSGSWAKAPG
ncbi:MAG: type I-G CRISPR-associated helicase/endonuclease Cas3g, partial [Bryobacteraceae bacterium]